MPSLFLCQIKSLQKLFSLNHWIQIAQLPEQPGAQWQSGWGTNEPIGLNRRRVYDQLTIVNLFLLTSTFVFANNYKYRRVNNKSEKIISFRLFVSEYLIIKVHAVRTKNLFGKVTVNFTTP